MIMVIMPTLMLIPLGVIRMCQVFFNKNNSIKGSMVSRYSLAKGQQPVLTYYNHQVHQQPKLELILSPVATSSHDFLSVNALQSPACARLVR